MAGAAFAKNVAPLLRCPAFLLQYSAEPAAIADSGAADPPGQVTSTAPNDCACAAAAAAAASCHIALLVLPPHGCLPRCP